MGSAVKSILPIVGTVVGAYFGGPAGAAWLGGAMGAGAGAAVGTAAGAAIGGAAGTALAGKPKVLEVPAIPAQTIMPTPDSTAVAAAKRRSIASQSSRQGRASTILTQGGLDGDKLGS